MAEQVEPSDASCWRADSLAQRTSLVANDVAVGLFGEVVAAVEPAFRQHAKLDQPRSCGEGSSAQHWEGIVVLNGKVVSIPIPTRR